MRLLALTLILLLLGIAVYLLFGWWASYSLKSHREDCPNCGQKTLKIVNFLKATVLVNGQRAPDTYTIYQCEQCQKRYSKSKMSNHLEELEDKM
jgi:DNA-directed RNA polymerase subunit RPC12/RpoP